MCCPSPRETVAWWRGCEHRRRFHLQRWQQILRRVRRKLGRRWSRRRDLQRGRRHRHVRQLLPDTIVIRTNQRWTLKTMISPICFKSRFLVLITTVCSPVRAVFRPGQIANEILQPSEFVDFPPCKKQKIRAICYDRGILFFFVKLFLKMTGARRLGKFSIYPISLEHHSCFTLIFGTYIPRPWRCSTGYKRRYIFSRPGGELSLRICWVHLCRSKRCLVLMY